MRGCKLKIQISLLFTSLFVVLISCQNSTSKEGSKFIKQHAEGFDEAHQQLLFMISKVRSNLNVRRLTLKSVNGDSLEIHAIESYIVDSDTLFNRCVKLYNEISLLAAGNLSKNDSIILLPGYNREASVNSYKISSVSKIESDQTTLKKKLLRFRNEILKRCFKAINFDMLNVDQMDQISWVEVISDTSQLDDLKYVIECFPIVYQNNQLKDLSPLKQYEYLRMLQSKILRALYRVFAKYETQIAAHDDLGLLIGFRKSSDSILKIDIENHYYGVFLKGILKYKVYEKKSSVIVQSGIDTITDNSPLTVKLKEGTYIIKGKYFWEISTNVYQDHGTRFEREIKIVK